VTLNIPICADDRVHCVDILDTAARPPAPTCTHHINDILDSTSSGAYMYPPHRRRKLGVDILDALTKNFLGTADYDGGDLADLAAPGPERKDYRPIGSTMQRQRHIYCARVIQAAWRRRRGTGGPPTDAAADSVVVDVEVDEDDAAND